MFPAFLSAQPRCQRNPATSATSLMIPVRVRAGSAIAVHSLVYYSNIHFHFFREMKVRPLSLSFIATFAYCIDSGEHLVYAG
jgi:hypothetical protein